MQAGVAHLKLPVMNMRTKVPLQWPIYIHVESTQHHTSHSQHFLYIREVFPPRNLAKCELASSPGVPLLPTDNPGCSLSSPIWICYCTHLTLSQSFVMSFCLVGQGLLVGWSTRWSIFNLRNIFALKLNSNFITSGLSSCHHKCLQSINASFGQPSVTY